MSACICGKHMMQYENEGTCLWCGHGNARMVLEQAYELNMRANTSAPLDGRALPTQGRDGRSGTGRKRQPRWTEEQVITAARAWETAKGHLPKSTEWVTVNGGPPHPTYKVVQRMFGGWPGFLRAIAEVPREQVTA